MSRVHSETFTTTDTPEEVVRFYKTAAEAGRLQTRRDASGPNGKHTFEASSGQNHLTVNAAPEGAGALARVSYKVAG